MVCCAALNGQADDVAGFLFALFLGFGFDIADRGGGIMERFLLDPFDDDLLALFLGHPRNALELGVLLSDQLVRFLMLFAELFGLLVQPFLARVQGGCFLVERFLALEQPLLRPEDFRPALVEFTVALFAFAADLCLFTGIFRLGFLFDFPNFFFGFQYFFLFLLVSLANSIVIEMLGIFFRTSNLGLRCLLAVRVTGERAGSGTENDNKDP